MTIMDTEEELNIYQLCRSNYVRNTKIVNSPAGNAEDYLYEKTSMGGTSKSKIFIGNYFECISRVEKEINFDKERGITGYKYKIKGFQYLSIKESLMYKIGVTGNDKFINKSFLSVNIGKVEDHYNELFISDHSECIKRMKQELEDDKKFGYEGRYFYIIVKQCTTDEV